MNYEAERAMNQKRLRMDGEPGHGVVQGNGLPLNYMDNGHQIPYQPYAGAYNTHYPPPDAFAAYGAPPPGGYAPQNLSYAPPAHQNYPHHQSFPQQQAQLHMPQTHMGELQRLMVQGYGDVGMHKAAWAPQQHLLPPLDPQKQLDVKQLKPEIKVEPTDPQKRPHQEGEMMGGEVDQPKIKIKTDIFKPDDVQHRPEPEKTHEGQPGPETHIGDKPAALKTEAAADAAAEVSRPDPNATPEKKEGEVKSEAFGSPDRPKSSTTPGKLSPGSAEKKRGRPKGSTNKPKPATPAAPRPAAPHAAGAGAPRGPAVARPSPIGRPRAAPYQYAVRPFRKDFSGIQFRRRWSDDCLDSSHIPNEVYFGDVPVSTEVLYNYYDANAERERLAAQAAQIAAQKAAAAKLAAAKLQARGIISHEVTTVDSSSSDDSSGSSGSEESESDDDRPLKKTPGKSKPAKSPKTPKTPGAGGGRRGRPPVPPELREPGITEMKKFCKAAGIRFDYKKLVEGCTKNKERVGKMMELLIAGGLEGKPTLEKCKALKQAKQQKKEEEKRVKKEAKVKKEEEPREAAEGEGGASARRVTRGQTGAKPRQKIVISSDEEDDTPDARRTLSKLRSCVDDDSDSG